MGSVSRACASKMSRFHKAFSTSSRSIRSSAMPIPSRHLRPSSLRRTGCLSAHLRIISSLTTSRSFPSHLSSWVPFQFAPTDDEDGT